jgi:hypothetical protein
MAKLMKGVKSTREPLLAGVPAERYLVLTAGRASPEAAKESFKLWDTQMRMLRLHEVLEGKQMEAMKSLLQEMSGRTLGYSMAVTALDPGPDGSLGVAILVETDDSAKWLESLGKFAANLKESGKSESSKETLSAFSHQADAEEIAGLKVHHMKLDLQAMEDIDPDKIEELEPIIGKEGVLVRFAPVDAKRALASFGGGAKRMADLIKAAQAKASPLDSDAGIKRVSAHLPAERHSVFYFAPDRIVTTIRAIQKAMGEEELPILVPELNAPIAVAASGDESFARSDAYLPMELIVAGKNVAMGLMMSRMAAPPGGSKPAASPPAGSGGEPKKNVAHDEDERDG